MTLKSSFKIISFRFCRSNSESNVPEDRGNKTQQKFDEARALHQRIDQVVEKYTNDMKPENSKKVKQLAVVTYLLHITGYHPGSKDGTPIGVGIRAIRVEHISFKRVIQFILNSLENGNNRFQKTFGLKKRLRIDEIVLCR